MRDEPLMYQTFSTNYDALTEFRYSERQLEAIRAALQALRPAAPVNMTIVEFALGKVDSAVVGTPSELPALRASLALKEEQLGAVEMLLHAANGVDEHIGQVIAKDRAALLRVHEALFASVFMERRYLEKVESAIYAPRTNPVEQAICDACADVWLQHGGAIENGGAFKPYFELVTEPKFLRLGHLRLFNAGSTTSKLKSYLASRRRRGLPLYRATGPGKTE